MNLLRNNFMKLLLIFCFVFISSTVSFSQAFFKPENLIETGVYYYPEAWNPSQWDRDFKNMAGMGFEFTHMAEFAWAMLEPEEGRYDFKWLDKAIELAAKYNLKVIMCTPSAAPPVWLTKKYPEVLVVIDNGLKAQHGTREQYSWSSTKYRELTSKIVTEMAKHYGKDKRIWGWQIDNEPSHYGTADYSPAANARFIEWLKKKYGAIDSLNKVWGTAFWSGVYSNFDQIEIPNPNRLYSGMASPHSYLDFKRFCADECASFVSMQYNTLRQYISKEQFVTTNFMNSGYEVNQWKNSDLDFISYTIYPVAGYTNGVGEQGFRLGNPWAISYANDFFRPLKGITGAMELQPGQVNWGRYNPIPYPGVIRAWLWNCFAGGLSFVCSYRFREPLFGSEQYHYGMVGTDGVTPLTGGKQYSQFIKEIKELRKLYSPGVKMPKDYQARKTAFLFNIDNAWETEIQKQTYQWNFENHMDKYYSTVKSFCAPVDFISEDKDFSVYPMLIAPAYQLLDKELVDKWKSYVENGGNLVLTCRTGQKDRNGHLFEAPWAASISELIGGKIIMYDLLPAEMQAKITFNEKQYTWNNWGDIIEPSNGTETWAVYSDQFYAGKAAVIHRKLGKGAVTYVGADTDDGKLEKEVIKKVYQSAGIPVKELPEGVIMHWRDGFWVAMNYSSVNVTLDIPKDAQIIFGTKELAPAGVIVWK